MNIRLSYDDLEFEQIAQMLDYCKEYQLSLVKQDTIDVSDFTLWRDTVTEFWFSEPSHAALFKLRFG